MEFELRPTQKRRLKLPVRYKLPKTEEKLASVSFVFIWLSDVDRGGGVNPAKDGTNGKII